MPRKQDLSTEQKIIIGIVRAIVGMLRYGVKAIGALFGRVGNSGAVSPSSSKGKIDKNEFSNRWAEIKDLLALGGASQAKQALIEADKLFDFALKRTGAGGNTMGERLIASRDRFGVESYQRVWQAHKLRNSLVHDAQIEVLNHEIKVALEAFEKGLSELGAI